MSARQVAHSVPVIPPAEEWEVKRIREWNLSIVGNPSRGYQLLRARGEPYLDLKASNLREAACEVMKMGCRCLGDFDMFFVRPKDPCRQPKPGFVYFIGGEVGRVKIGFALNPEHRLRDLQCGSPVELRILATAPGMPSAEREYHKRFAEHRAHREWFERSPEILAEIERLKA